MDVRRGTCAPLKWFSAMKEPGNDVLETCDLLKVCCAPVSSVGVVFVFRTT